LRADRRRHAQEIVPDDRTRVPEPGDLRAPDRGRRRKCRRCWPSLRRHAAGVDAPEGGPVDSGTRRTYGAAALLRRGDDAAEGRYQDDRGEAEGLDHRFTPRKCATKCELNAMRNESE